MSCTGVVKSKIKDNTNYLSDSKCNVAHNDQFFEFIMETKCMRIATGQTNKGFATVLHTL